MNTSQKPTLTLHAFHRDGESLDTARQNLVKDVALQINKSGLPLLTFTRGDAWAGYAAIRIEALPADMLELQIAVLNPTGDYVVSFRFEGLPPQILNLLATGLKTDTSNRNHVAVLFTPTPTRPIETTLTRWSAKGTS